MSKRDEFTKRQLIWLEQLDGDALCSICPYSVEGCHGGVRGGPSGPIYPPCADDKAFELVDYDSAIEAYEEYLNDNELFDWSLLYFGHMHKQEVLCCVKDPEWQALRIAMKGSTTEHKYHSLTAWLKIKNCSREAQVQVTNYVTALSRGGLIKPSDYLEG